MKTFKNFLVLIFLTLNIYSYAEEKLVFGISLAPLNITEQNHIKKFSFKLLEKMKKQYKQDFNIIYYDDEVSLVNDFTEKKNINAIVLFPELYFEKKDLFKKISINPFIFKHSPISNAQLFLIANKDSGIKSINDIKNKTFINTLYMQNYTNWLDYLTLKKLNKSYKNVIADETISKKSSTGLLDVYFNKADFCIIEKDIYEDMLLLNPSLEKKLTIIEKSPEVFFTSILTIHKDASAESIASINDMLVKENFNENFKEFFKFLNLDSASRIEFEDLKDMENFYSEYMTLKKKNN